MPCMHVLTTAPAPLPRQLEARTPGRAQHRQHRRNVRSGTWEGLQHLPRRSAQTQLAQALVRHTSLAARRTRVHPRPLTLRPCSSLQAASARCSASRQWGASSESDETRRWGASSESDETRRWEASSESDETRRWEANSEVWAAAHARFGMRADEGAQSGKLGGTTASGRSRFLGSGAWGSRGRAARGREERGVQASESEDDIALCS